MELLSASRAVELGTEVRNITISKYIQKTIETIMGRIQEVIDEGFVSGDISIEQYVDDWSCEPAGWCTVVFCAPSVELYTAVMNAVEDRFTRLGYEITFNVVEDDRVTAIIW